MVRGDSQKIDNVPSADFAKDEPANKRLDFLDVLNSDTQFGLKPLRGLDTIVIGGGPAGLLFARSAAAQGANVIVIEKAGDPRNHHAGYTNRSFNITLDDVGRRVLNDPKTWEGGIWLVGRAMHNKNNKSVLYGRYGENDDRETDLISIPRSQLRRNMVNRAIDSGVSIKFKTRVIKIDPDEGTVECKDSKGQKHRLAADLLIVGDGMHSIGNSLLEGRLGDEGVFTRPEPRSYVTARLKTDKKLRLSLQHIHFWHDNNSEAYTVGIPNGDGTISLLLTSIFEDFNETDYPFSSSKQADMLLRKDFSLLHSIAGDQLIAQLPHKSRGFFKYKAVSSYVIGKKAVLVGDAGCAVPPWAGFGANNGMYGAASLVYHLVSQNNNLDAALAIYQAQQLSLSRKIMQYVLEEGEFFSGPVQNDPSGRSDEKLCRLIKEAQKDAVEQLADTVNKYTSVNEEFAISEL